MGYPQRIENVQTIRRGDPMTGDALSLMEDVPEVAVHPLDTPESQARLRQLEDWWYQARQAQSTARYDMARDQDFYDGLQWSDEDILELIDRGQLALVFNKIKPSTDWVLGTEKRTRMDFKVHPRAEDDVEGSENKTKLIKYLQDVNKAGFARSRAFADATIVGLGWLEDGIRADDSDEPLFSRYEDWRNMWYDHLGVERDGSDWRYVFRSKWVDLDVAIAMFPDREAELRAAAVSNQLYNTDDDEFYWLNQGQLTADGRAINRSSFVDDVFNADNRRDRVRLIEAWYRTPGRVRIVRGAPRLAGEIFNEQDPRHVDAVDSGLASIFDAVRMQVRCAMFVGGAQNTSGCLLQDMVSPYRHNRFPFTPIWCYQRGRDKTPYGMVRNLRDPQEDLNKRRSKALYILSTNKMIADNDAFEDWDEVADEMSRPDMILRKKKGSQVELITDTAIVEEHVLMARDDAEYIQDASGVTSENLGKETNATSGVAIHARQDQGTTVTAEMFDNYRYAFQIQGETQLSLIEQFYDQPKVIRLLGTRGKTKFLPINQPAVDEFGQETVMNDITAAQADFIVDAQDFRESIRLAMSEQLMELCGRIAQFNPEAAFNILDMVVDLTDLPGKDELVKRVRQLNGQSDPEAADNPEAQAELLAKEQAEQEQADIQRKAVMNELAEQEAKVRKLLAETKLILEKAQSEETTRNVGALKMVTEHDSRREDRDFERERFETDTQFRKKEQEQANTPAKKAKTKKKPKK